MQLIDCEYSRGPLYRLSEADLIDLPSARSSNARRRAGHRGFFPTHTRKGITLDPDDVAVLDAHFREPHQIRPAG